jgi:hypothetical protein
MMKRNDKKKNTAAPDSGRGVNRLGVVSCKGAVLIER